MSYVYFAVLVLCNLMWAYAPTGLKAANAELSPIVAALVPMIMSTIVLTPFMVFSRRARLREGSEAAGGMVRQIILFLILGTFGPAVAQGCLSFGVSESLASNASVLSLALPLLCVLFAMIILGERPAPLFWISFVPAIAGALLVSKIDWHKVRFAGGGNEYLIGNAVILVGFMGSAFNNTFSKKLLRVYSPAEVIVYASIVGEVVLFGLTMVIAPRSFRELANISPRIWWTMIIIAVFSHAGAMMLFFWVIKRIDMSKAALTTYMFPVFGVVLAVLFLNERLTWHLLAGGCLVLAGAFLGSKLSERKQVPLSRTRPQAAEAMKAEEMTL